ncbi:MAG TPA: class I SAM-dependent methyltransferase [Spirochaetota bacterium]|nr:class I SAM-dependent methyltransferase [Spirochaetota bacterium]HNT12847.1 class I SAM-dependent methyltransferase [Spirochaetota bacterium]
MDDRFARKTEYFNRLAPNWDDIVGNDGARQERLAEVFARVPVRRGMRVLDVGCGNGVLVPHIVARVGSEGSVCAIDAAPAMIERARTLHGRHANVRWIAGDIETCGLPEGAFDIILCFAVFPHVADKARALAAMRTLLAPGGRLVIFHLADTASLNSFHASLDAPVHDDMMPGRDELEALFADTGFRLEAYEDAPGLNYVEAAPC